MSRARYLLISVFVLFCSFVVYKITYSYFADTETVLGNSIQVGVWGITPTETPTPTTTPGNIVINEVFYRVDVGHRINDSEAGSEWVELYNPGIVPVSLSGWSIEDNTSCDNVPGNPIIPGNGFAIVSTHTEAEFQGTWPAVPLGVIFIQSPTAIGNGLANNDELILRGTPCETLGSVDHISWGSNTDGLNPSIPMTDLGHSSERDPNGLDTNTAGDFIEQTNPTPGS